MGCCSPVSGHCWLPSSSPCVSDSECGGGEGALLQISCWKLPGSDVSGRTRPLSRAVPFPGE